MHSFYYAIWLQQTAEYGDCRQLILTSPLKKISVHRHAHRHVTNVFIDMLTCMQHTWSYCSNVCIILGHSPANRNVSYVFTDCEACLYVRKRPVPRPAHVRVSNCSQTCPHPCILFAYRSAHMHVTDLLTCMNLICLQTCSHLAYINVSDLLTLMYQTCSHSCIRLVHRPTQIHVQDQFTDLLKCMYQIKLARVHVSDFLTDLLTCIYHTCSHSCTIFTHRRHVSRSVSKFDTCM